MKDILNEIPKEEIIKYLKIENERVRNNFYPDNKIGFPQSIQKEIITPPRIEREIKKLRGSKTKEDIVRLKKIAEKYYLTTNPLIKACKYGKKYVGQHFKIGDKPLWIYVNQTPIKLPDTESIAFFDKIPRGFIPDWDKVCNRVFEMNLKTIFESSGFGTFPVLHEKNKKLNMWFK